MEGFHWEKVVRLYFIRKAHPCFREMADKPFPGARHKQGDSIKQCPATSCTVKSVASSSNHTNISISTRMGTRQDTKTLLQGPPRVQDYIYLQLHTFIYWREGISFNSQWNLWTSTRRDHGISYWKIKVNF